MIRRAFWVLLAAVLCAGPVAAQEITGSVMGTVVDSSKAAIPGATVKIEGGSVNQTQVTDEGVANGVPDADTFFASGDDIR